MKKLIVEGFGTFFLVLFILLMVPAYGDPAIALGVAFVLMAIIYSGGPISAAHYNPAVTLAFWLRGQIKTGMGLAYIIVQFLAAFLALQLANGLHAADVGPTVFALPELSKRVVIAELIGTFLLVFVILRVATTSSTAGNEYYGLAIGTTVGAGILALSPFSRAMFNPVVTFAFIFSSSGPSNTFWVYVLTQLVAAILAWGFYNLTAMDGD
ncbi:MAG: aquaporin [Bacteroidota bacterium]